MQGDASAGGAAGRVGRWRLSITAAGFIAYGFYQLVHARYLRIRRMG